MCPTSRTPGEAFLRMLASEDGRVVSPVAQPVEVRHTVIIAGNSFAVDDTGARTETRDRLDDRRETPRKIVPLPAV
jgi:hypothetical protein